MRLFLLIFFILYGSMHLYAFLKAKAAFAFGIYTGIYVALVMIIMVFAPIIVRLSEKAGFEFFARLMSYIGYTWMGMLFLFVSASLSRGSGTWGPPIRFLSQPEVAIIDLVHQDRHSSKN